MRNILTQCLLVSFSLAVITPAERLGFNVTKLDEYVAKDDGVYKFHDTGIRYDGETPTLRGLKKWTGYLLRMTSCQWMTPEEVSQSVWEHDLVVIVPETLNTNEKHINKANIWITDGHSADDIPKIHNYNMLIGGELATDSGLIVGVLFDVPVQPITFYDDPTHSYTEDGILAQSIMRAINDTSKPEWAAHFPMTKASIKAMDTIETFIANETNPTGHVAKIDKWIITGASKRGWITWLVAAVAPDRCLTMIPVVFDLLNILKSFHHMWRSYGGWTFVMRDYVHAGLPQVLDSPEAAIIMGEIDPYFYRERLTMPKLVVNSADDEFFMNDNTHYWWSDMPGPKHFMLMPNAEHVQVTGLGEELPALKTYINAVLKENEIPEFTWEIDEVSGSITVDVGSQKVHAVHMYHSTSCSSENRRDYRAFNVDKSCSCGFRVKHKICLNDKVEWHKTQLEEEPGRPGIYVASQVAPTIGWTTFFADVTFPKRMFDEDEDKVNFIQTKMWEFENERKLQENDLGWPIDFPGKFEFTTLVSILPNTFPYEDCSGETCLPILV